MNTRFTLAVTVLGLGVGLRAAHADPKPVSIGSLPTIEVSYSKGKKPTVVLYSTGLDADVLVRGIARYASFVMPAGKKHVEGRIEGAPWSNAVAAVAGDLPIDYIAEPRRKSTPTVDFDFTGVTPHNTIDILRICGKVAGTKVVIAEHHELAPITLRTRRRDPHDVAKAIAKLVGLELVERKHTWYFVEPGTARSAEKQVDTEPAKDPVIGDEPSATTPFGGAESDHWKLRATVGVLSDDPARATEWLAIFISDKGSVRYVRKCGGDECAREIDATHAKIGDRTFALER